MADGAKRKLLFAYFYSRAQRPERGVRGSTRARDRRVAAVLSVTGIIDEKKGVVVRPILAKNCRPIECERTVPAKCDPKTFRKWCGCGNVIRTIFRGRDRVINFHAVCRQRIRVALVVRPRMVNHRVLPKIEDR